MAYCPLCGKDIGESSWCPKCVGTKEYMEIEGRGEEWKKNEEEVEKSASGSVITIPKRNESFDNGKNVPSQIDKKDEILDFKAVTTMSALTLFITFLLYSYTPTYAFIIGCFGGGFINGRLFKDKLTTKTGLISIFVGFVIALIVFALLTSF